MYDEFERVSMLWFPADFLGFVKFEVYMSLNPFAFCVYTGFRELVLCRTGVGELPVVLGFVKFEVH